MWGRDPRFTTYRRTKADSHGRYRHPIRRMKRHSTRLGGFLVAERAKIAWVNESAVLRGADVYAERLLETLDVVNA